MQQTTFEHPIHSYKHNNEGKNYLTIKPNVGRGSAIQEWGKNSNKIWLKAKSHVHNSMIHWPLSWLQLNEQLKTVDCSYRGLRAIPKHMAFNTESLILSHNNLESLYRQLPTHLDHLYELDVSYNKLRQLGRTHLFINYAHLRRLDLSGNHFKTLFGGIFRGLKRVEWLIMQRGQLRFIDENAFAGLENLQVLDLQANQITSIYLELFQSILNLNVSICLTFIWEI